MARIQRIQETVAATAREPLPPLPPAMAQADAVTGDDTRPDAERFRDAEVQNEIPHQHEEPGTPFVLGLYGTDEAYLERTIEVPKYLTHGKVRRGILDDVARLQLAIGAAAHRRIEDGGALTASDVLLAMAEESVLYAARMFIAKFCDEPAEDVLEGLSLEDTRTALNLILAQVATELEDRKKGLAPAKEPPSAGASSSQRSSAPTRNLTKNSSRKSSR